MALWPLDVSASYRQDRTLSWQLPPEFVDHANPSTPYWPPKAAVDTWVTGYNCDRPIKPWTWATPPTGAAAGAHSHGERAVVHGRQRRRHRHVWTTSCGSSTPAPDSTRASWSSRTAASASVPATAGSCCKNCWGRPASNYDASWTEYGSLVGVPIELGSKGFIVMCGAPEQTQQVPPGRDLRKHTVLTGTARTAGTRRRCLRAATQWHWGVHRRGGVLSLRPVPLHRRPPASGPSAPYTDPASARPSSLPPIQACFRSTSRCRKRIQRAESGKVGGEGQRRGLQATLAFGLNIFEGKGCVEGARSL